MKRSLSRKALIVIYVWFALRGLGVLLDPRANPDYMLLSGLGFGTAYLLIIGLYALGETGFALLVFRRSLLAARAGILMVAAECGLVLAQLIVTLTHQPAARTIASAMREARGQTVSTEILDAALSQPTLIIAALVNMSLFIFTLYLLRRTTAELTATSSPHDHARQAERSTRSVGHESSVEEFCGRLQRCTDLKVFEGLPHPFQEPDLFRSELESAQPIVLAEHPFYPQALALSAADTDLVRATIADPATHRPYRGPRFCGGFHPDFVILYSGEDERLVVQLCFGCIEMKTIATDATLHCDLEGHACDRLRNLLVRYHRFRPSSDFFKPEHRYRSPPSAFFKSEEGSVNPANH